MLDIQMKMNIKEERERTWWRGQQRGRERELGDRQGEHSKEGERERYRGRRK